MRFFLGSIACAALIPFFAFAQSGAARAGITPESPFYFFDRIAESVTELFAFSSAARARTHLSFAAERIAEIEEMLAVHGVSVKGISVADDALSRHLEKSAVLAEKVRDVVFANKINEGIQQAKELRTRAFHAYKDVLTEREREARAVLKTENDIQKREKLLEELGHILEEKEGVGAKVQDREDDSDLFSGSHDEAESSEQEILDKSIQSVEEEIRRTEEFLRKKQGDSAR